MKVQVFESLYWVRDIFDQKLRKFTKKNFRKIPFNNLDIKTVLFPFRQIRYIANNRERIALIDMASLSHTTNQIDLIFLVRNDLIKFRRMYMDLDENLILKYPDISNKETIKKFIEILEYIQMHIAELGGYQYLYAEKLAKFDLNRIILGSLQKKDELYSSKEKASQIALYRFIKGIIEDGLGLKGEIQDIYEDKIDIYMPITFLKEEDKVIIVDSYKNRIKINKNISHLYTNDPNYREWIKKI